MELRCVFLCRCLEIKRENKKTQVGDFLFFTQLGSFFSPWSWLLCEVTFIASVQTEVSIGPRFFQAGQFLRRPGEPLPVTTILQHGNCQASAGGVFSRRSRMVVDLAVKGCEEFDKMASVE